MPSRQKRKRLARRSRTAIHRSADDTRKSIKRKNRERVRTGAQKGADASPSFISGKDPAKDPRIQREGLSEHETGSAGHPHAGSRQRVSPARHMESEKAAWRNRRTDEDGITDRPYDRSGSQSRRYQRTKRRLFFDDDISPEPEKPSSSVSPGQPSSPHGKSSRASAGKAFRTAARKGWKETAGRSWSEDEDSDDLQDSSVRAARSAAGAVRDTAVSGTGILHHGRGRSNHSSHDRSSFARENREGITGGRLRFGQPQEEASGSHREIRKGLQKKRIRRSYAQALRGAHGQSAHLSTVLSTGYPQSSPGSSAFTAFAAKAEDLVRRNLAGIAAATACLLFMIMFFSGIGMFASMTAESGGAFVESTYLASDDAIRGADELYEEMEDALQEKISRMEETHPGYEEYNYQIDEIVHDPFQLASYLTARYGNYTPDMVKKELKEIFDLQYSLSTHAQTVTKTVTRTVRVGESLGTVVTSGYCNCAICCGRWAGGPTASGKYPRAEHTIAVDASNPFVPMGTHVVMNGHEYVVEDTGAFARYGVQFDVYYDSHSSASAHGHKRWTAYLADSNGKKEVEITETKTIRQLNIRLTSHDLEEYFTSHLTEAQKRQYGIYSMTLGNRDYLFPAAARPLAEGGSYQIPPEAMSDRRFARMIKEAEKYLGYPYVWGGSRPSTSFDCSGFVCWVVNHCGNGWDVGRTTAEGLRKMTARVSASQARPGDLVFFKGTYNTSGASHVGIYVGNGTMIHCGNPIKYSSIQTKYWQSHLYQFGRLP